MMPGLDGLEIYDKVRADPDIKDMPMLFVSAAASRFGPELAKRGITDVIAKPFDLNDLLDRARGLSPPYAPEG